MSEQKLTPQEIAQLTSLQREVHNLVQMVGQAEVRKHRLMAEIADCEQQAQTVMRGAAERLGIAPGDPWQMTPEGDVVMLDATTGRPLTP